jgi:hypothetical protein
MFHDRSISIPVTRIVMEDVRGRPTTSTQVSKPLTHRVRGNLLPRVKTAGTKSQLQILVLMPSLRASRVLPPFAARFQMYVILQYL